MGRAVAIRAFEALAGFPALARNIPGTTLRRLVAVAGLPDMKYEGIYSQACYAPWRSDREFLRRFGEISPHTLVDEYRCHELWTLVAQTRNLPRGDLLEVGVWRGGTGCLIAVQCRSQAIPGTVYLCDTFKGVVNAGANDPKYVGGEHSDTSAEAVSALATRLGLDNVMVLKGMFPQDTGVQIDRCRFRFCHIDVDVYDSARQTFEWVWPRLLTGGIVVFDDYGFYSCTGVARFVDEMRGLADRLVIYNVNGHAIVVKLGESEHDRERRPAPISVATSRAGP